MLNTPLTQLTHAAKPFELGRDLTLDPTNLILMVGPCSVESYEQTHAVAKAFAALGGKVLRGGAFKPRTSPDSFHGLGREGLEILRDVADQFGMLVITEALAVADLPLVASYADIIQIGSRNMQHYPLLWAAGELDMPVMLKRGFMSTIDEWLKAADHISSRGNQRILLCERGIRTFETATRNTFDTNAIALVKMLSPYPVIGDPSHATGRADLVIPAARAAIAAGADGLIIEAHPHPASALSDGDQALALDQLPDLIDNVTRIAHAMNRTLI